MSRSLSSHIMGIVANVFSTEDWIPTWRCVFENSSPDILRFLDVPFCLELVECLTFVSIEIVVLLVDWIELTALNICETSVSSSEESRVWRSCRIVRWRCTGDFVRWEVSGWVLRWILLDTVWFDEFLRASANSSMVRRLLRKFRISFADKKFQSMTTQQAYKLKLTWLEPYYTWIQSIIITTVVQSTLKCLYTSLYQNSLPVFQYRDLNSHVIFALRASNKLLDCFKQYT